MLAALGSDTQTKPPARLRLARQGWPGPGGITLSFADLDSGILPVPASRCRAAVGRFASHRLAARKPSLDTAGLILFGADTRLAFAGGLCEITSPAATSGKLTCATSNELSRGAVCSTLRLARSLPSRWDRHPLRPQTLPPRGSTSLAAPSHPAAESGSYFSFGNVGAIELTLSHHLQARTAPARSGLPPDPCPPPSDGHLAPVDGKAASR